MSNATIDIRNTAGGLIATVLVTKDAERVEELMTADYAQLSWQSDSGTTLPAGAYIIFENEKLSLLDPYEPEQKDEFEYSYKPQFQSRVMGWGKVPFFHYTYGEGNVITAREPDWTLTDTPVNFMAAICKAIKNETGETWTYEVAEGLPASVTLSFNASDILSGLNSIASAFDTEWLADKANNVLTLGKAQHGTSVTLQVDCNIGVPSVTRSKEGYYNRFYVYGSTRNITQDYQGANVNNLVNKRLTLNPATYPNGYIDTERPAGTPIYPKILIFDDIYPHSGLTLANLRPRLMYRIGDDKQKVQVGTDASGNPVYDMYSIWYFQLPNFTLNNSTYSKDNPNGMLISGKALSVHFKSGALQGREFELIYHPKAETLRNSDGQDFNVLAGDYEIKFVEENGLIIPMQTGIVPADGDEVILFNIRMPQEYIATAYTELEQAALKEIEERYTADLNNYTVKSNPVAFAEADPGLSIGQRVVFVNGDYSYTTRVILLARKMDYTCEQEITIGNDKIKGNNATLKEEVVNANSNINILTQLNQLTQNVTQAYQRTQQLILDGLANAGDPLPRIEFDDMFEKVVTGTDAEGNEIWYIQAKRSVACVGDFVAYKEDGSIAGGTGAGVSSLGNLTDVKLNSPSNGDVLTWNGFNWVNAAAPSGGLDESALASYLTSHNYVTSSALDGYVTLATEQTISGKKKFTAYETEFGSRIISTGSFDSFENAPHFMWHVPHTRWTKALMDTFGNIHFLDGGATDLYDYRKLIASAYIVNGGTASQFLKADGSVDGNGYVNRAGDTMTGPLNVAHNSTACIINGQYDAAGNYTNVVWADSPNNHVVYGSPMWSKVTLETSSDHIRRQTGTNFYKIWDSGNDGHNSGLDADTVDGYHNGQITAINVEYCSNENRPSSVQFMQKASGWNGWDAPSQNWFTTIKMNHGNGDTYFHRTLSFDFFSHRIYTGCMQGGSHIGWKTLAFLDDNVATASELYTARNIWGQSFKGNNNVSGRFELDGNAYGCLSIFDGGTYRAIQTYNLAPLCLNTEGNNVGIYTTNPQAKLHVNGDMITNGDYFFQGYDGTLKIYSMPNTGQPAAYESETVVIQTAFDGQDPKTSYYPQNYPDRTVLALQPRGGRVGIGTAAPSCALHVIGNILATGEVTFFNGSDRRIKTNLRIVSNALGMLRSLGGYYSFDYTDDARESEKHDRIGLIYQNVIAAGRFGELMGHVAENGYGALNYIKADYINLIGASVLEVDDEVTRLKRRVNDLENKVKQLKRIA